MLFKATCIGFYFCNPYLDRFSGPSSMPCDTALPIRGAGSAINYLFLGFKNTPVSHHGRTQPLLEALQHVPRRQLRLRVCCWPERRQQLQRVQAGLCWETPTKVFFWAAEISNEE